MEAFSTTFDLLDLEWNIQISHVERFLTWRILNLQVFLGSVNSCYRLERLAELAHFGVQKAKLKDVMGKVESHVIDLCEFCKPLQKSVGSAKTHVEIKGEKDLLLHLQYLVGGICIFWDVNEILK